MSILKEGLQLEANQNCTIDIKLKTIAWTTKLYTPKPRFAIMIAKTTEINEELISIVEIFLNKDSLSRRAKWVAAMLEKGNVILRRIRTLVNSGALNKDETKGEIATIIKAKKRPRSEFNQKIVFFKVSDSSFLWIIAADVPRSLSKIPRLITTTAIAITPYSLGGIIFAR